MLLKKSDWRKATDIARSHTHTLRRLFEDKDLSVDAVLCIDRRPTLCVLDARGRDDKEIERIRRRLWNLGATTLLLVETATDVRLYSTLSKPSRKDERGTDAQLTDETIASLQAAALAQQLTQLIRRVETGAIYRDEKHASRFAEEDSVDRMLLTNLREARNRICPNRSQANLQRAHQLIGRFLFSCYLLDRGIVGPPYLRDKGLPEADSMLGLLHGELLRGPVLEKLFNALHKDFNGSLFGEQVAQNSISEPEATVLLRLVAGEDLRSGQLAFADFKLYDFSFVPVEFISSIYEEFLAVEAIAARRGPARQNAQRASGAYYTPPRLAELTVDIATEGWTTLGDKRCLDCSCGSGIFLVILFVRMAEEWRREHPNATTLERYEGLRGLLRDKLHGVDIQVTACLVACFSLYLAFLDQMEPKEISELRLALDRNNRQKILPGLLWLADTARPRSPNHFATVREADFFSPNIDGEFDLTIGNPPWVSRKPAPEAEAWLYSQYNPEARRLGWSKEQKKPSSLQKQTLFPDREVTCAFMWKSHLHMKSGGRVCQVLPSRVFLSNNKHRFQAAWLRSHRLESVWLLADYSFILFKSAECPCAVVRFHTRAPDEALGDFEFVTPKVQPFDPRHGQIPILPEDQKQLSEQALIAAADTGSPVPAWKMHHWGTPRDLRLIERLMAMPRLEKLASRPPRMKRTDTGEREAERKTRWWKGQGYQPLSDDPEAGENDDGGETEPSSPWTAWWSDKHLYFDADSKPEGLVLSSKRQEMERFGERSPELRRTLAPELARPPLVLVNTGFSTVCFSDSPVVFRHAMQAVAGPAKDKELLLFLAAYLDSALAKYLAFHTAANLGIERDKVLLEEITALPFPLPEQTSDRDRSERIVSACVAIIHDWQSELEKPLRDADTLACSARRKLFKHLSNYFGLCEWERELITDTADIFRPSSTPGSLNSDKLITAQPSLRSHRKEYAETLVRTFGSWTRGKKTLWAHGHLAEKSGLALLTFGTGGKAREYDEDKAAEEVERIVNAIRASSAHEGGTVFRKLRGFAFYEDDRVHLLKPMARRHWTRTAALNDADEIIARMMEEGGWGDD